MASESEREELVRSYDELRYPYLAHRHTDPDRLATIARLHGIVTPPVDRCRVLELGCAVGGNLAAMSMSLPNARFVGVDISEGQIEQGRAAIAAAGIGNVDLCALDLMDLGKSLGTFDYIVAQGLLSWVSRDAQDEILAIFARCLAPNGVAFLGYNTKPGWHELSSIRDGFIFDARGISGPHERVRKVREYLTWLRESLPGGGRHGQRFIDEVVALEALDDETLVHEYLGPHHAPIHFRTLVARAARYGLTYLCDAEPALSADHSLAPEAERARAKAPDELIHAEQYYDYLCNRRFRRSLFCRREAPLTRNIDVRLIDELWASSRAQPVIVDQAPPGGEMTFRAPDSDLTTGHPVAKAALLHLASVSPRAIPFAELIEGVRARLGLSFDPARDAEDVRQCLASGFLCTIGVVTLRTHAPPFVAEPGTRPVASGWARHLAQEANRVPNLDHDMVVLDTVMRRILPLVDGTRDRAALEASLASMVERGEIVVQTPDGRRGVPAAGAMDRALRDLARNALLVS